jgi:hypothetical protein
VKSCICCRKAIPAPTAVAGEYGCPACRIPLYSCTGCGPQSAEEIQYRHKREVYRHVHDEADALGIKWSAIRNPSSDTERRMAEALEGHVYNWEEMRRAWKEEVEAVRICLESMRALNEWLRAEIAARRVVAEFVPISAGPVLDGDRKIYTRVYWADEADALVEGILQDDADPGDE